jgi:hypothetical protein
LVSSYQEGKVGIQLSRGEGWYPVIKRGGLVSNYQEGRVGIQSSRGEGWYPINQFNPATFFACPKPGSEFPTSYDMVYFVFSEFS